MILFEILKINVLRFGNKMGSVWLSGARILAINIIFLCGCMTE